MVVDDVRAARINTAADLVEQSVSETLTYYAFPSIRSNRLIMREIRRRARMVGAFLDGYLAQSCCNTVTPHRRNGVVEKALNEHASLYQLHGIQIDVVT